MFKWASVAEEVADEMEKIQAEAVYNEDSATEQKRLRALSFLNEAAEGFDFAGYKKESEVLTHLIEKIAQDNFEEEAPETPEASGDIEPVEVSEEMLLDKFGDDFLKEINNILTQILLKNKDVIISKNIRDYELDPNDIINGLEEGVVLPFDIIQDTSLLNQDIINDIINTLNNYIAKNEHILQSINPKIFNAYKSGKLNSYSYIESVFNYVSNLQWESSNRQRDPFKFKTPLFQTEASVKLAQDNFEEEAPETFEQQDEQPGLEEPKQLDTKLDALDALNYYSNLVSQGNQLAMKEYIPGVMYLRTVMLGNPKEEVFAKFEQEGVPGWIAQIAQLNPGVLKHILSNHLESIGSSLGRIDSDLATLLAAAPKPDLKPTGESGEQTAEDLAKASLPEIVPMDAAELAVWRRYQSGEGLTPEEEQILERKRKEAEIFIEKQKSRESFREKQREERSKERDEKLQEQAPSAVRRIDPLTGRVKEEIPVELGKGRGGAPKWKSMTREEKERQSRQKSREKKEAPPERFTGAQVYPEGRFWMVELPGETRPKRFQTQEQAINFTQGKVGNEFKVLKRAPIRASRLDIIEKLAGQYEDMAKKDTNKAVDKQIPIEETAPPEEYWEDE